MDAARDADDEPTQVIERSAVPQSGIRVAEAHPSEPPRDTILDRPSAWRRARAFMGALVLRAGECFRRARLSDRLPPLPSPRSPRATYVSVGSVPHDERGEQLLLDILRAAPPYQEGAIFVANYAIALRKLGEGEYADGLLHFALSRMRPDADGFVSVARLRDRLPELSYLGVLVPALTRLEATGIIVLATDAKGCERVQLRRPL